MPATERNTAFFNKLKGIIRSQAPDASLFRRELSAALAAGFPIGWDAYGHTLLHQAAGCLQAVRAGLPQILIASGADANGKNRYGYTALGNICWRLVSEGRPELLDAVDILLAAGADPGLDGRWKGKWMEPEQRARRDWLEAYIAAWTERRAALNRSKAAAPAFDYAL